MRAIEMRSMISKSGTWSFRAKKNMRRGSKNVPHAIGHSYTTVRRTRDTSQNSTNLRRAEAAFPFCADAQEFERHFEAIEQPDGRFLFVDAARKRIFVHCAFGSFACHGFAEVANADEELNIK